MAAVASERAAAVGMRPEGWPAGWRARDVGLARRSEPRAGLPGGALCGGCCLKTPLPPPTASVARHRPWLRALGRIHVVVLLVAVRADLSARAARSAEGHAGDRLYAAAHQARDDNDPVSATSIDGPQCAGRGLGA